MDEKAHRKVLSQVSEEFQFYKGKSIARPNNLFLSIAKEVGGIEKEKKKLPK